MLIKGPANIDQYIAIFPKETQNLLKKMRMIIMELVPDAEESFSYGMPAYKTNGRPLVYFAGYKGHIGFYATPTGHAEFKEELANYKQGKGSVQFPLNKPIPYELIKRIIKFKANENKLKIKK